MNPNWIWTLDRDDQLTAKRVARERIKYNSSTGYKLTNFGDRKYADLYFLTYNDLGGEYAFDRMFGTELDTGWTTRYNYDTIMPSGKTVDVKCVGKECRMLVVKEKPWKSGLPDLFACVQGRWPTYEFVGFIRSRDIIVSGRRHITLPNGLPAENPYYSAYFRELNMKEY